MAGKEETQAVLRRLVIAAVVVVVLVLGLVGLARAGIWIPWWVPVLAFAVIVAAALARVREWSVEDEEEGPEIAGRIGDDEEERDRDV